MVQSVAHIYHVCRRARGALRATVERSPRLTARALRAAAFAAGSVRPRSAHGHKDLTSNEYLRLTSIALAWVGEEVLVLGADLIAGTSTTPAPTDR